MMRNRILLNALFLAFLGSFFSPEVLQSQALSREEREILMLQDQRSLADAKLVRYLSDSDARLRYRAAVALGNLQDTSTVGALLPLLADPDGGVRAAAAFALGQVGSVTAQESLIARLSVESDMAVAARMLEALGKCGDEAGLDWLLRYEPPRDAPGVRSIQAISVARFALRGLKHERSIWFSFGLLTDPDADTRWSALYALWRSAPHGLIDVEIAKHEEELSALAADPSDEIRSNLAALLGRSRSAGAGELLRRIEEAESRYGSWRVQVQAVRARAELSKIDVDHFPDLTPYLRSPNDHVKIAALQALAGLPRQLLEAAPDTAGFRDEVLALVSGVGGSAEMVRGEAFIVLARFFPEDFVRMNLQSDTTLSLRERSKVLEALSHVPTGRSLSILLHHLDHDSARVAMAAWDFIRRFLTPSTLARMRGSDPDWTDIKSMLYRKTISSLLRGDMAVTNLVANAVADTAFFNVFQDDGQRDTLVKVISDAYANLASPNDVEPMQAVLEAMGKIGDERFVPVLEKALHDPDKTVVEAAAEALSLITGQVQSDRIPKATKPLRTDYDWSTLESLRPERTATLRTSKGNVRIALMTEHAPFTVLSFVKLARRGFYDGLLLHRVVPNFVVQGGDPRGDGWGGPGYAIRSEFSLVNFARGMIGIASAGKDTEGCQFFITHAPAPHLDGRYTIFARVIEGMDVVDRLQIGDVILGVTIE